MRITPENAALIEDCLSTINRTLHGPDCTERDTLIDNEGLCFAAVEQFQALLGTGPHDAKTAWAASRCEAFEDWDGFSGCTTYPITVEQCGGTPKEQFNMHRTPEERWLEGPYALARQDLLEHLIAWYGVRAQPTF